MLEGEEPSGAAEAGHHLVQHEESAGLVAAAAQRGEEARAGDAHASLGLDRLDDHRGRAAVDGPERGFVVEGDEGHVGE